MAIDWDRSRSDYYTDFVVVPLLVVVAVLLGSWLHGFDIVRETVGLFVGVLAWTLFEYVLHRWVFHSVLRRQHWVHHLKPAGFTAAPAWLTSLGHLMVFGALVVLTPATGLFTGFELGYFAYIVTHDRIHHRRANRSEWLRRRWQHHMLHHGGMEVNFGVVTNLWDRIFGTYNDPKCGSIRGRDHARFHR